MTSHSSYNTMAKEQDPYLRHLFDGTDLNVYDHNVMNLSAGAPGPDLLQLCVNLFQEATRHCLEKEKEKAYLFQYGIAPGMWEFREELAKFLSKQYGEPVLRELLVQTCGATHGLQLAMIEFLWPDSIIFVEDATYMLALQAFQKYPHMKIVTVPITDSGLDAEALEKIVSEEYTKRQWNLTEERPFWAMLYTIPVFHNPTGTTMKESKSSLLISVQKYIAHLLTNY
ncbi:Uncharacterized protein GBIM_18511, partial [Gryllus bimaculatus]